MKSNQTQLVHQSNFKNQVKKQQKYVSVFFSKQKLSQFQKELDIISLKLKELNNKKICSKQLQWGDLKSDISQVLSIVNFKEIKIVFERKFQQEIKLLNDLHTRKYRSSMFQMCFMCFPYSILKQLKYYKFIDDDFEASVSKVEKTFRTIYFYLHLLYIQLFLILISMENQDKLQKKTKQDWQNQQLSKSSKLYPKKQKKDQSKKNKKKKQKIETRMETYQNLDQQVNKQGNIVKQKEIRTKVEQIISRDWKDIIDIEEWCSRSYRGFIQIDTEAPIETFLEFKDCKLKTNHLFEEISSSSFDLRTYLVRRSKSISQQYQFVLEKLHPDSLQFQLRFWLAEDQRTPQNQTNIQKYILLSMRIGIKERISRMCQQQFIETNKKWMIHNYLHLSTKPHTHPDSKPSSFNQMQSQNGSEYLNLAQEEPISPQKFWWVNLGQKLIKAIVKVSIEKIKYQKSQKNLIFSKQSFAKKKNQNPTKLKDNLDGQNDDQEGKQIVNKYTSNYNPVEDTIKQSRVKINNKPTKSANYQETDQNMQTNQRLMMMDDLSYYSVNDI